MFFFHQGSKLILESLEEKLSLNKKKVFKEKPYDYFQRRFP